MKFVNKLIFREIAGKEIVTVQKAAGTDLTRVIKINETSGFLIKTFMNSNFTEKEMAVALTENFEISHEIALKDVKEWLTQMKAQNIICE